MKQIKVKHILLKLSMKGNKIIIYVYSFHAFYPYFTEGEWFCSTECSVVTKNIPESSETEDSKYAYMTGLLWRYMYYINHLKSAVTITVQNQFYF